MKDVRIENWQNLNSSERSKAKEQIRIIFFQSSSRQSFADEIEREAFFEKWTSFYFLQQGECIWVALSDQRVVGYLTGCKNSTKAGSELGVKISSYSLFQDLFANYPAHLHVNVDAQFRGLGIGEALIESFVNQLLSLSCPGVHIVTSPGARNTAFYRRLGFTHVYERQANSVNLLFMGRSLGEATRSTNPPAP